MRFINTTTLGFQEVPDLQLHKLKNGYSILSHRWTWGEDEIQYVDILSMGDTVKAKKGFAKFTGACALAKSLGHELIWIDTCCINKADAAELSEAINSMYRWYSKSQVCIAYLQDVNSESMIRESVWFERGWTLQELIAPRSVKFYGHSWNYLGSKAGLSSTIVAKTGIPADVLKNAKHPRACSVAQRMSWAAKRTTQRIEDRAYSLMGLFDVNMPMIYGERGQAFIRLQEHIIAKSADESIFVWSLDLLEDSTRDAKQVHCGLLASSPACFARCGDIINTGGSRGFQISQFGLIISSPAMMNTLGTYHAPLRAKRADKAGNCALILTKLPDERSFVRTSNSSGESFVTTEKLGDTMMQISVPLEPGEAPPSLYHGYWLRKLGFYDYHISSHDKIRRLDGGRDRCLLPQGETGTAGIIRLRLRENGQASGFGWIKLGFDSSSRPVCLLAFPPTPDNDRDTRRMPAQAEELLAANPRYPSELMLKQGSSERMRHPFFDSKWTNASSSTLSSLPSYCYDSRLATSRSDGGFDFDFQAPLFKISVSAKRMPDSSSSNAQKQEVWAVSIVAGTPPPEYSGGGGCCTIL
ncbi:HET-domain-containing protein [Hypoxylon sp. FL1284]|nr:HET-domain-containing protein [Hypoxylon sp. FL1284]